MPITSKDLTVAIVQAELDALEITAKERRAQYTLAVKERRDRLRALLAVLRCEAKGQRTLPLCDLEVSLDATDDGTMPTTEVNTPGGTIPKDPSVGDPDDWKVEDRTPGAGA